MQNIYAIIRTIITHLLLLLRNISSEETFTRFCLNAGNRGEGTLENSYTCVIKYPAPTSSEEEAEDFCRANSPFALESFHYGEPTKCTHVKEYSCEENEEEIMGKCFILANSNGEPFSRDACPQGYTLHVLESQEELQWIAVAFRQAKKVWVGNFGANARFLKPGYSKCKKQCRRRDDKKPIFVRFKESANPNERRGRAYYGKTKFQFPYLCSRQAEPFEENNMALHSRASTSTTVEQNYINTASHDKLRGTGGPRTEAQRRGEYCNKAARYNEELEQCECLDPKSDGRVLYPETYGQYPPGVVCMSCDVSAKSIVFVLDASDTMGDEGWSKVLELISTVGKIVKDARTAMIVTKDDRPHVAMEIGHHMEADFKIFIARNQDNPGVYTVTGAGMRMARLILEKETADDRILMIFATGQPDIADGDFKCDPLPDCKDRQLEEAELAKKTGIRIIYVKIRTHVHAWLDSARRIGGLNVIEADDERFSFASEIMKKLCNGADGPRTWAQRRGDCNKAATYNEKLKQCECLDPKSDGRVLYPETYGQYPPGVVCMSCDVSAKSIVFVLDASDTMGDEGWSKVLELISTVSKIVKDARTAMIVTKVDRPYVAMELGHHKEADFKIFIARNQDSPGVFTVTGAGMKMARLILEKETADDRILMIFATGQPDIKDGGFECDPLPDCGDRQLEEAELARKTGIRIIYIKMRHDGYAWLDDSRRIGGLNLIEADDERFSFASEIMKKLCNSVV